MTSYKHNFVIITKCTSGVYHAPSEKELKTNAKTYAASETVLYFSGAPLCTIKWDTRSDTRSKGETRALLLVCDSTRLKKQKMTLIPKATLTQVIISVQFLLVFI